MKSNVEKLGTHYIRNNSHHIGTVLVIGVSIMCFIMIVSTFYSSLIK